MILKGLKSRIYDALKPYKNKWIKELPYVVWGLRTQPSRGINNQTLFFMVYGSEAILPADLLLGAPRVAFDNEVEAENTRLLDIDLVEEERLAAQLQSVRYQQSLKRYHDRNAKPTSFQVGDLVLHRIQRMEGRTNLSAPWEGPFIVSEVTRPGSFRLKREDGTDIPISWNAEHLKRFYP
jgi:hypothetical protein